VRVKQFSGPLAEELVVQCRPDPGSPDTVSQVETIYRALVDQLARHRATFREVTSENLFLRDIGAELPRVLDARARIMAEAGQVGLAPMPAFIGQAPAEEGEHVGLTAWAVIPHRTQSAAVRDLRAQVACACDGCAQSGARLLQLGDQQTLESSNLYGSGSDAYEQTWNAFVAAEQLLQQCGMSFKDVSRTWIYLRDIDRDYDALNRARREFFRRRGIELRPASTGVQGAPFAAGHDIALRVRVVRSDPPPAIARMSTPSLNEAWSYGADFSRGLRLTEANKVALHVSGTASLDETGRSVHQGDLSAQIDRMLDNLELLLQRQGASFRDVVSAVTYLKRPGDAAVVRSRFQQRGFGDFPCPLVDAPLCRPELLCEAELVAVLPLANAGV
jgi:enamine deaminase RidA (YjgF/YER057c/UK114 family)